jgi:hypothetical protein
MKSLRMRRWRSRVGKDALHKGVNVQYGRKGGSLVLHGSKKDRMHCSVYLVRDHLGRGRRAEESRSSRLMGRRDLSILRHSKPVDAGWRSAWDKAFDTLCACGCACRIAQDLWHALHTIAIHTCVESIMRVRMIILPLGLLALDWIFGVVPWSLVILGNRSVQSHDFGTLSIPTSLLITHNTA